MRISKITVNDFRAFPHVATFDLTDGANLLVYGENGSGKSSLFQALREFFRAGKQPPPAYSKFKNIFIAPAIAPPAPGNGKVSLELMETTGSPVKRTVTWAEGRPRPLDDPTLSRSDRELLADAAARSSFLEYRSLLRTNFDLKTPNQRLFELAVSVLLADVPATLPGRGRVPIKTLWSDLKKAPPGPGEHYNTSRKNRVANAEQEFNVGLKGILPEVQQEASKYLAMFEGVGIELKIDFNGLRFDPSKPRSWDRHFIGRELEFKVSLNGEELVEWTEFLNEARLSALALSLYLAGVRRSDFGTSPDPLRLLVLDDVLIGLDLGNRIPVLRILERYFPDYQVVLLTHDRVWFEMAQMAFQEPENWISYEMYAREMREGAKIFEAPVIKPPIEKIKELPGQYLQLAENELNSTTPSLRTAAFHARVALEIKLKAYCHGQGVPVQYDMNPRMVSVDDFMHAVEAYLVSIGHDVIGLFHLHRIHLFKKGVLNPSAHFHPVTLSTDEVKEAVRAVKELELHKTETDFPLRTDPKTLAAPTGQDPVTWTHDAACWVRVTFEVELRRFLKDRGGRLPFTYTPPLWPLNELWESAKARMNELNAAAATSVIAAIEGHRSVLLDEWKYARISGLSLTDIQNAWAALKDPTSTPTNVKTILATFP